MDMLLTEIVDNLNLGELEELALYVKEAINFEMGMKERLKNVS